MKNIISVLILMICLFVSHPELVSGHPELVSGPPEELTSASPPELVSGSPEYASNSNPGTTISATATSSVEATVGDLVPVEKGNFFTRNWGILLTSLLGFADVVTRLTPTEKDNSIVNFLVSVLNAIIPNLKKGGGRL